MVTHGTTWYHMCETDNNIVPHVVKTYLTNAYKTQHTRRIKHLCEAEIYTFMTSLFFSGRMVASTIELYVSLHEELINAHFSKNNI